MIRLVKVGPEQGEKLFQMRRKAFLPVLERYQDFDTNPAAESWEDFQRYFRKNSDNYFIQLGEIPVGTLRVVRLSEDSCRLSPISILPEYQGKGYAQQALLIVETLYPLAKSWSLDTIKQEPKLVHLYKKLGYRRTGEEIPIKEGMTLVVYQKGGR